MTESRDYLMSPLELKGPAAKRCRVNHAFGIALPGGEVGALGRRGAAGGGEVCACRSQSAVHMCAEVQSCVS